MRDSGSAQSVLFQAMPSPPRTPSDTARRVIFKYQGSQFVYVLLGVIFTAIGLPMTVAFNWSLPSDVLLSATGKPLRAQVLDVREDRSVTVNGEHPLAVRFEYRVDGARHEDETSTIHRELTSGLSAGSLVEVEYAPSVPEWARLKGGLRGTFGYFGLLALIFPVVGLFLWRIAVRGHRRQIRAYTWGQPIAARKTFFGPDTSTELNHRHPWLLRWEFDLNGRTYTGKLSSMRAADLEGLASGETLPVLYLEDDPSVNTAYVP